MIIVRGSEILVVYPMGTIAEKIIKVLKERYGIEGEVKEVWCG